MRFPDEASLRYQSGRSHLLQNKLELALQDTQEAYRIDSGRAGYSSPARHLPVPGLGDTDDAIRNFLQLLSDYPDLGSIRSELGSLYETKGELDLAIEEYLRAIDLDPGDVDLLLKLSEAYLKRGDFATCHSDGGNGSEAQSRSRRVCPPGRCSIGVPTVGSRRTELPQSAGDGPSLLSRTGRAGAPYCYAAASSRLLDNLIRAVEADPTLARPYADTGLVYMQLSRWEQAASAYQEALRLSPATDILSKLGLIYLRQGEYEL